MCKIMLHSFNGKMSVQSKKLTFFKFKENTNCIDINCCMAFARKKLLYLKILASFNFKEKNDISLVHAFYKKNIAY